MANIEVPLETEDLRAVLQNRMYEMLDEKTREQLIREALAAITAKDRYADATPIEQAFRGAMRNYAQEVVKQYVDQNDELKGIVLSICQQAFARLMDDKGSDAFRELIAESVAQAIRAKLWN